ncbi:MAG: hypothetical protein ACRDRX_22410 [Pseudonocardiaceae bacterium]
MLQIDVRGEFVVATGASSPDHSGIVGTKSSQPLPEQIKELSSSSLIEAKDAGAINMRVQHDLPINLADPEIAEPPATVDLASDGDSAVVRAHNMLDC